MSKIGNKIIACPTNVSVWVGTASNAKKGLGKSNSRYLAIKGTLGSAVVSLPPALITNLKTIKFQTTLEASKNNTISFAFKETHVPKVRAEWGLTRATVDNAVIGVSLGFTKELNLVGLGLRSTIDNNNVLFLSLGYSHGVSYIIPEGVSVTCPKPTTIVVSGINKQLVNQVAAKIRNLKKPEPYKGKGIQYKNEIVLRKEGKKK